MLTTTTTNSSSSSSSGMSGGRGVLFFFFLHWTGLEIHHHCNFGQARGGAATAGLGPASRALHQQRRCEPAGAPAATGRCLALEGG
jgi:hypothetical protein